MRRSSKRNKKDSRSSKPSSANYSQVFRSFHDQDSLTLSSSAPASSSTRFPIPIKLPDSVLPVTSSVSNDAPPSASPRKILPPKVVSGNLLDIDKSAVVVIGGGIAGVTTAIELAKAGKKVVLIERSDEVLSGSSDVTPGRMGLGFHYVHIKTALMYLKETIDFVKYYGDDVNAFAKQMLTKDPTFPQGFRIGEFEPEDSPLRRGRYFIVKSAEDMPKAYEGVKTLFSKENILHTYEEIKQEYRRLCEEDPSNQVFGEPDDFYRMLDPSEYEHMVNTDLVDCAVETKEHLLHWHLFRAYLSHELEKYKANITIHTRREVVGVEFNQENRNYTLSLTIVDPGGNDVKDKLKCSTDMLVNCTWQNAEGLTQKAKLNPIKKSVVSSSSQNESKSYPATGAGSDVSLTDSSKGDSEPAVTLKRHGLSSGSDIPMASQENSFTNRLKIIALVKLPPDLIDSHSMFFAMGPHCMFSNLGNGYGALTYAPVTNFMDNGGKVRSHNDKMYRAISDPRYAAKKGRKIIEGVTKYIPKMKDAILADVRYGFVVTPGEVNIYRHDSPFHQRNFSGVVSAHYPVGWIDNLAMKLLYGYDNAKEVVGLVHEQEELRKAIPGIASDLLKKYKPNPNRDESEEASQVGDVQQEILSMPESISMPEPALESSQAEIPKDVANAWVYYLTRYFAQQDFVSSKTDTSTVASSCTSSTDAYPVYSSSSAVFGSVSGKYSLSGNCQCIFRAMQTKPTADELMDAKRLLTPLA